MQFEWDTTKNRINIAKHGLSFEMAHLVFENFHITKTDDRQAYGEDRFLTMGTLGPYGRIIIAAHTLREGRVRIISMRKANIREQKIFQAQMVYEDD